MMSNTRRKLRNTAAVRNTTVPRGTTKVRTAASATTTTIRTPATISSTLPTTVTSVFVDVRAPPALLDLPVMTFLLDPLAFGRPRRRARHARRIHVERLGQ